jgi:hypothetical protein
MQTRPGRFWHGCGALPKTSGVHRLQAAAGRLHAPLSAAPGVGERGLLSRLVPRSRQPSLHAMSLLSTSLKGARQKEVLSG